MTRISSWITYGVVGLVLTVLVAVIVSAMTGQAQAVWVGAGVAYGVQLIAFALLLWLRPQPQLFMIGWLGGMALRFMALAVVAFWVSRTDALPRATTLVSLVGFVFLLLLLEPLFLRWDLRRNGGNG